MKILVLAGWYFVGLYAAYKELKKLNHGQWTLFDAGMVPLVAVFGPLFPLLIANLEKLDSFLMGLYCAKLSEIKLKDRARSFFKGRKNG